MATNTENAGTEKSSSEKQENNKLTNILAIANILVTLFVGVVVAYFLQSNNQKFQNQLLERQNELQFVDIRVTNEAASFKYENLGKSTAKNIRIVFCFVKIKDEWKDIVKDTRYFTVITDNSAMKYTATDSENACYPSGDNPLVGKLITFESLPPNQSISFALIPKSYPTSKKVEYQGTAYILAKVVREQLPASASVLPVFPDFLTYKFAIAQFRTDVYCDNCRNSSGTGGIISAPPVETYTINSSQTIGEDNNGSKTRIDFSLTYQPLDGSTTSANNILYLLAIDSSPFFQEIDKNEFESSKP